jgi:type VI secretion system protein ImpA
MAFRDDLLTPIAGENPAGTDLRYDPVYDKLKEARREELDVPAGDWEVTRKTADWPQVIKLAGDTLATRSKDLQLAVWLTEALLHREGFGGLRSGLDLMRDMLDQFWDHLYPELEDDDAEMRAAPLSWLGMKLDLPVRMVPLNLHGHNLLQHRESQTIPTEAEAEAEYEDTKRSARKRAIEEGKVTPEAFEQGFATTPKEWYRQLLADIDGSLKSLVTLDDLGEARFGADAPSYLSLRGALTEVRRTAEQLFAAKLKLEPDEAPAPGLGDGGVELGLGAGSELPYTTEQPGAALRAGPETRAVPAIGLAALPSSREEAASRVAAAARYMQREDPTDPASYLLLRGFRWGELRADGDLDPRLLGAPPTEARVRLKHLLLDGSWPQLLESAEDVMATPQGRGWLDLQRYLLTACEGLGSEYDSVAAGVRGALRALLQDFPRLPELTLMDDSPTCNSETREWLRAEGILAAATSTGDGAPESFATTRPGRGRLPEDRAIERVRAGEPQEGIEILMQAASRGGSARGRFLLRTRASAIMLDHGMAKVALPVLQELAEQVEKYQLEEWEEGAVTAEALGLLYRCLARVNGDYPVPDDLYLRICRLDPLRAIQLTGAEANGDDGQGG